MATSTHSSDVPGPSPDILPGDIPGGMAHQWIPSYVFDRQGNYIYDMEYGCKVTPESEEHKLQLLRRKLRGHEPSRHLPGYLNPYSDEWDAERAHDVHFGLGVTMKQLHEFGAAQGLEDCTGYPECFADDNDAISRMLLVQGSVIDHLQEACKKESNGLWRLRMELIVCEKYSWAIYLYNNKGYKKFKKRVSQEEEDAIIKKIQSLLNITDPPMWYHADYSLYSTTPHRTLGASITYKP